MAAGLRALPFFSAEGDFLPYLYNRIWFFSYIYNIKPIKVYHIMLEINENRLNHAKLKLTKNIHFLIERGLGYITIKMVWLTDKKLHKMMTISKNAEGREVCIYTEDETHLNPRMGLQASTQPLRLRSISYWQHFKS